MLSNHRWTLFCWIVFVSLGAWTLTGCSSDDDMDMSDDISFDETYYEVTWRGEEIEYDRVRTGPIPGGERTQIWLEDDDFSRRLIIRWGRDEDGNYFNEDPSIQLEFEREDGEEEYTLDFDEDLSDMEFVTRGNDEPLKAEGEVMMRPFNSFTSDLNPDGGLLEIDIQIGD